MSASVVAKYRVARSMTATSAMPMRSVLSVLAGKRPGCTPSQRSSGASSAVPEVAMTAVVKVSRLVSMSLLRKRASSSRVRAAAQG
jgi:hypothetical protein